MERISGPKDVNVGVLEGEIIVWLYIHTVLNVRARWR